jgi:antitoxin ParD1/3/4
MPYRQESNMPTRNVVLTDHQATFVEELVAGGRYQNASEVLREGLRLIEKREIEDALRLDALRSAVQAGLSDSAAGKFKSFDSPQALGVHLKAMATKAIANK